MMSRPAFLAAVFAAALPGSASAGLAYPGCAPLQPGHFRMTRIFDGAVDGIFEPNKLAFDMRGPGEVDVYALESRDSCMFETQCMQDSGTWSQVRRWDARAKSGAVIGRFLVDRAPRAGFYGEHANGIALDPAFRENGWIYLKMALEGKMQVQRYTLRNGTLDTASRTVLWQMPTNPNSLIHTGGGLAFDAYGYLWFSAGDFISTESGPANTADPKGKIFRIRPRPVPEGYDSPGAGRSYDPHPGNLGPHWAARWERQGRSDLAAQYRDPAKVLPEIYVMGTRNPYTITLDPVRSWVTFGDCGPDMGQVTEEHNLAVEPGNYGWPYWAGDQVANQANGSYSKEPVSADYGTPQAPLNNAASNRGVRELPPALAPIHAYKRSCAITGPIYRFDPSLASPVKFPPHFHGKWLVTDYNQGWIQALTLDSGGTRILARDTLTGIGRLFSGFGRPDHPLDLQMGPDGALYVAEEHGYHVPTAPPTVYRIEYTGPSCAVEPGFRVEKAGCMVRGDARFDPAATHPDPCACADARACLAPTALPGWTGPRRAGSLLRMGILHVTSPGAHTVEVLDLRGKALGIRQSSSPRAYAVDALAGSFRGILLLRVTTLSGRDIHLLPRLP